MLIAASAYPFNRGVTEKQSLLWLVPSLFLLTALPARWLPPSRPKFLQAMGSLTAITMLGNFQFTQIGATIQGSYGICENDILITIKRKPFLESCNTRLRNCE
jgi:hypothetical protein